MYLLYKSPSSSLRDSMTHIMGEYSAIILSIVFTFALSDVNPLGLEEEQGEQEEEFITLMGVEIDLQKRSRNEYLFSLVVSPLGV